RRRRSRRPRGTRRGVRARWLPWWVPPGRRVVGRNLPRAGAVAEEFPQAPHWPEDVVTDPLRVRDLGAREDGRVRRQHPAGDVDVQILDHLAVEGHHAGAGTLLPGLQDPLRLLDGLLALREGGVAHLHLPGVE